MPSPSSIPRPNSDQSQTFEVVPMHCDAAGGYVAANRPFPQAIPHRPLAPPRNIDSRPLTTTSDAPVLGSGPIWGFRELTIAVSYAAEQSHEAVPNAHPGAGSDVPAFATYPPDYYSTSALPGSAAQGASIWPSSELAAEVVCWPPLLPYFTFAHPSAGIHAFTQERAAWLHGQQFGQGFTHAELSGPPVMPYFEYGRSITEPTIADLPIPSVTEDHAVRANERYHCVEICEDGTICNASLCDRKGLEKHIKTVHHKGFQAPCPRCGKVFSRPDAVKRHNARVNCFELQANFEMGCLAESI